MLNIQRRELMPELRLSVCPTDKFKTSLLSLNILRPLKEEDASMLALLPQVLRRGSQSYPDMRTISAALDELYGASLEPLVRKKGETQCLGFYCSFVDSKYVGGEDLLEKSLGLLADVLLHPLIEKDRFTNVFFNGEKENLLNQIAAAKNNKTAYAMQRMIKHMCAGEPYGVDRLGSLETAEAISNEGLFKMYERALSQSRIEIFYSGAEPLERVEGALTKALEELPRRSADQIKTGPLVVPSEVKSISESMDVTQGKLSMGFRNGVTASDKDYPAVMLLNAVFGGTVSSKLFLNVRERLSLCYYASSSYDKLKGLMFVNSGIEFDKLEETKAEILRQLELCRQGEISDEEIEGAKKSLITSLKTGMDSQFYIEDFYLEQSVAGVDYSISDLLQRLELVSRNELVEAAEKTRLDTVYFLKGAE